MDESGQNHSLLYRTVLEYVCENHEEWVLEEGYGHGIMYITKRHVNMYLAVKTTHNHITLYYQHNMSPINSFRYNDHELLETISSIINKMEVWCGK